MVGDVTENHEHFAVASTGNFNRKVSKRQVEVG